MDLKHPELQANNYAYCAQVRSQSVIGWCKRNIAPWPNEGVWTFRLIGHAGRLHVRVYTNDPEHHALVQLHWGGST
jgi:hypothetical protein